MPRVKLASQKLQTGGSPGGLRPITISSSAVANIRPPQLNPNAGNVGFKPMPVPKIQQNVDATALAAAGNFASTMGKAAFDFEQRQAQADADAAVLAYDGQMRDAYHGTLDAEGNAVKGYSQMQRKEAIDGYAGYADGVNSAYAEILENLSPSAREKAMLRMTDARNRALGRAATHNARQHEAHQAELRYLDNQNMRANIKANGVEEWTSGAVEQHAMKYSTPEERDAALGSLATFTAYEAYNNVIQSGQGPMAAAANAEQTINAMRGKVPETEQQKLEHWLLKQKASAEKQARREARDQKKEFQARVRHDAPRDFKEALNNNNEILVQAGVAQLRMMYDTPEEASKAIMGIMNDTFDQIAEDPRFTTVSDRVAAVDARLEMLMDQGGNELFTDSEMFSMQAYVDGELPARLTRIQNSKDRTQIAQLTVAFDQAEQAGEAFQFQEPPSTMLPENRDKWRAVQERYQKERREGVTGDVREVRAKTGTYYENLLTQRQLTEKELDRVDSMFVRGNLSGDDYNKIIAGQNSLKKYGNRKPEYQKAPGYVDITERIKQTARIGKFVPGNIPEKGTDEFIRWKAENEYARAAALGALDKAVRKSAIDGQAFDYDTWWNEYVKNTINSGSITNDSFTQPTTSVPSPIVRDIKGTIVEGPRIMAENLRKNVRQFLYGDVSVMDDYEPPGLDPMMFIPEGAELPPQPGMPEQPAMPQAAPVVEEAVTSTLRAPVISGRPRASFGPVEPVKGAPTEPAEAEIPMMRTRPRSGEIPMMRTRRRS